MTCCFDSMLLVWGIQQAARPGQEDRIPAVAHFIKRLQEAKQTVLVPAPVLCEFLAKIAPERHPQVLAALAREFRIAPLDARSASLAAVLWQEYRQSGEPVPSEEEGSRTLIKVDCQIVAIAISNQADCIYSYDPHLVKIAGKRICVREVPTVDEQLSLFEKTAAATVEDEYTQTIASDEHAQKVR